METTTTMTTQQTITEGLINYLNSTGEIWASKKDNKIMIQNQSGYLCDENYGFKAELKINQEDILISELKITWIDPSDIINVVGYRNYHREFGEERETIESVTKDAEYVTQINIKEYLNIYFKQSRDSIWFINKKGN